MLTVPSSGPGRRTGSASSRRDRTPLLLASLSTPSAWVAVIALSVLAGAVVSRSAVLATAHLLITFLVLAWVSVFARRPDPILLVTIYAGLCDVWWRAAGAHGPWEASKYALIIGFAAILIRFIRHPRHVGLSSALVLLLVPGAVLGTWTLGLGPAREYLVSNLSGLVAVALGVLVCSNLRVSAVEMRGLYPAALSPIVALTTHATLSTIEAQSLTFTGESNFTTSGGFGPNQVSSILCFGGLLCILMLLQRGVGWRLRLIGSVVGVWMVGQAVLTFSRGGLFGLVLACGAIGLVALTMSGQRTRVVVAAGLLILVAVQVLSWAGAFTGGESEQRLSSTDSTNRADIAEADVRLFLDHPILGVGVGISPLERDFEGFAAPHTEYSRLLAEHGVFGLAAIGVLAAICVGAVRRVEGWYRMAAVGLLIMALAQMVHSATRIGSIGVAFALASLLEDRE